MIVPNFFIIVDGEHGVFSCWTWIDALSYCNPVSPFSDRCCCRVCGSMYPWKEPFLDKHFEALHRLLWGATEVNIFLDQQIDVLNMKVVWVLFCQLSWSDSRFIFAARDCAKIMVNLHAAAPGSKLRAVYKKFCNSDLSAVALLSPAKDLSALSWASLGGEV